MPEAILSTLAGWALRATILALAVAALLWLARIKDVRVRLAAWTVVLLGALLMPIAGQLAPSITVAVPRFLLREQPPAPVVDTRPAPFPLPPPASFPAAAPQTDWARLGVILWLAVASTMLLKLAAGWWLGSRLLRASTRVDDEIRESEQVAVPVTIGLLRPKIVLPAGWRSWSDSQFQAVLAHERSHIERRDPLRQFAASIYRSLAWFHPLAWWLRAQLAELAEAASDEAALAATEDPITYAEMLLTFIERAPRRVQWTAVAMATRQSRARRIDRICSWDRPPACPIPATLLILIALPLVPAATLVRPVWAETPPLPAVPSPPKPVLLAQATPQRTVPQPKIAPTAVELTTPYTKWMTEDVAYIITDAERTTFKQLTTDEEREQFIEQFWLRRDPTPDTRENEFKQEHYRRIAYANTRFAASVPGWKTDRGRIYIQFGPPDEIETHPSGGNGKDYPYEQWLYHHIDGIGSNVILDFEDKNKSGDFHMTFDPRVATVEVMPDRRVRVLVPIDVEAKTTNVFGRIVTTGSRRVTFFETAVTTCKASPGVPNCLLQPVVERLIPLVSGSYRLEVVVTDLSTSAKRTHTVDFSVP